MILILFSEGHVGKYRTRSVSNSRAKRDSRRPRGAGQSARLPTPRGEDAAGTVLSAPVSRYMTAKPSFVYADDYAVDLLKVFARKRIDDLPVCDRRGKVVGIVDIQDLPKMKVL